jgi:hypothetical protein
MSSRLVRAIFPGRSTRVRGIEQRDRNFPCALQGPKRNLAVVTGRHWDMGPSGPWGRFEEILGVTRLIWTVDRGYS